jgi:hypothetical protein
MNIITLSISPLKGEDGNFPFALLYQSQIALLILLVHNLYLYILDIYRKLKLYPKGSGTGVGTCLSLYLILGNSETLPPNRKFYAKYKLRIRDQIHSNHCEKTGLFS